MYLNEAMQEGVNKVDEEIVYAGLHAASKDKKKFADTKKFSSKYTKARGTRRRRKGRRGWKLINT